MKLLTHKFLLVIFYLLSTVISYSTEQPNFKNLIVYSEAKKLKNIEFKNNFNEIIKLNDYKGKLVILNFWATWWSPCKKEMPSLDKLFQNAEFRNLQIFAINTEQPNPVKTKKFFTDLNIQKLNIFFDQNLNFVKEFKLRGVPTTILINKDGKEFARIVGAVDFQDSELIEWLKKFE